MEKKKEPKIVFISWACVLVGIIIIAGLLSWVYIKKITDIPNLIISISMSVLTSLVASFIFALFQRGCIKEEKNKIKKSLKQIEQSLRRQNELYDSGIESIHPKAYFDDEKEYWEKLIFNTEKRLDLIGHSISPWFSMDYKELFRSKVIYMLKSENEVRIIMSGEEIRMENIKRAYYEGNKVIKLNKVETSILELVHILDEVEEEKREYLKVYFTDNKDVTYLYIRTDSECIISPYIRSSTNSQNSFLMKLTPGTKYAKAFENDFIDFIEKNNCLDLKMENIETIKEIEFYRVRNKYSGSNWDNEITEKYVFQDINGEEKYEVGCFEHYQEEKYIKTVIELPVSYGCPSKCKFCASSMINSFKVLSAEQMMELFQYIYDKKELYKKEYILISITGSGDIFYNFENVEHFMSMLKKYKNVFITISSCLWNKKLLTKIEKSSENLSIRNIQITYVSDEKQKLEEVIPAYLNMESNIQEVIEYIESTNKTYYRINYIMIQGVNDSEESWQHFIQLFFDIKDKIVVRISKLNQTQSTIKNGLEAVDEKTMLQFKLKLEQSGIKSYLFYAYCNDCMNCGQLITER